MWNYQVSHFEVCPDPGKERGKTSAASKPFVVTLEIRFDDDDDDNDNYDD